MHPRALIALAALLCLPSVAAAQGVTLDQYRPAETARGGFAISRPVGLGHVGFGARLDVDYGLEALTLGADTPVEHELAGNVSVALGLFERLVVAARLPVVLVMEGTTPTMTDPTASGAGLGDVGLSARWLLHEMDVFALALQVEATIPTAEAASPAQDLAGEAGVSFTPEAVAELRFSPVWVTANLGLRFREAAQWARLDVRHEMTWGLGVGVAIVEARPRRVGFDMTLEGYGATPLDDFADAARSPVEAILGARLYPSDGLVVGLAGGLGIGDGYGTPSFRGVATIGWANEIIAAPPELGAEGGPDAPLATRDDATADPETPEGPVAEGAGPAEEGAAGEGPRDVPDYGNLDRDGDRLVDAMDRCPLDREDHDEIRDDDGCPELDADEDQVADVSDFCPLTPGVVNEEDERCNGCPALACVSDEGTITITERVEFATGSDRILERSEAVLTDVLSIIQTNDQIRRVRVEGHTDDRGRDARNLRLSRDRAASVMRWLVEHGLDPERLEGWGCGEAHPISENRTRRGRQTNRRVEFYILEPPTAGYSAREGCAEVERAE